jgi:hypothetical protein
LKQFLLHHPKRLQFGKGRDHCLNNLESAKMEQVNDTVRSNVFDHNTVFLLVAGWIAFLVT